MRRIFITLLALVMLFGLAASAAALEEAPEASAEADEAIAEEPEDELPVMEPPVGRYRFIPRQDGALDMTPVLYSSDVIRLKIYALQDVYYPGMPWGDYKTYTSPVLGGGTACLAFAYTVSDAAFDDLGYRKYYRGEFSYDDIHIGDILWEREWVRHAVVVLEKYDDHLCFVEGNFNSAVLWGRQKSRQDCMDLYEVLITRYPRSLKGDVNGDKCIEAWDAAMLLQYLAGRRTMTVTEAADVSGDGFFGSADAACILALTGVKQDGLFIREPAE